MRSSCEVIGWGHLSPSKVLRQSLSRTPHFDSPGTVKMARQSRNSLIFLEKVSKSFGLIFQGVRSLCRISIEAIALSHVKIVIYISYEDRLKLTYESPLSAIFKKSVRA